jgi:hypothetical protein
MRYFNICLILAITIAVSALAVDTSSAGALPCVERHTSGGNPAKYSSKLLCESLMDPYSCGEWEESPAPSGTAFESFTETWTPQQPSTVSHYLEGLMVL